MRISDWSSDVCSSDLFSWDMLAVIAPYSLAMASVGLLESLMTAKVVDDLTESTSSKARECTGLGLANFAAGLFGGIAGCGMIGQTVGNVRYGGRGRLSTLVGGVFLLSSGGRRVGERCCSTCSFRVLPYRFNKKKNI